MKTSTARTLGLVPVVIATLGTLMTACGPQDGGSAKPQAVAAVQAATAAPPAATVMAAPATPAPVETAPAPQPQAAKPAPVRAAPKPPAMQKVAAAQPAAPAPAAAPMPRPDTVGAVKAIEPITETKSSGAGAVVGGLLGGVVGHQFGKGDGKKAMTVVGAVGGAVAGNAVERHKNEKVVGYRVKVQLDNGETRTFEPAQLGDLKVGDRVRVDQGTLHKA
jgi:outer membrane lipoprotein SlyB